MFITYINCEAMFITAQVLKVCRTPGFKDVML